MNVHWSFQLVVISSAITAEGINFIVNGNCGMIDAPGSTFKSYCPWHFTRKKNIGTQRNTLLAINEGSQAHSNNRSTLMVATKQIKRKTHRLKNTSSFAIIDKRKNR